MPIRVYHGRKIVTNTCLYSSGAEPRLPTGALLQPAHAYTSACGDPIPEVQERTFQLPVHTGSRDVRHAVRTRRDGRSRGRRPRCFSPDGGICSRHVVFFVQPLVWKRTGKSSREAIESQGLDVFLADEEFYP